MLRPYRVTDAQQPPVKPSGRPDLIPLAAAGWVAERFYANPGRPGFANPLAKVVVDELLDGKIVRKLQRRIPWADDSIISFIPKYTPIDCPTLGDFLTKPTGFSWTTRVEKENQPDKHAFSDFVDETWIDVLCRKCTYFVLKRMNRIIRDGADAAPHHIARYLTTVVDSHGVSRFARAIAYEAVSPGKSLKAEYTMLLLVSGVDTLKAVRHYRPDYLIEPGVLVELKVDAEPEPELDRVSEPTQMLVSIASIANMATTPSGMQLVRSLLVNDECMSSVTGLDWRKRRRLRTEIRAWLDRVGAAPQYHSPLVALFRTVSNARMADNAWDWYVSISSEGLPVSAFSSANWPFFLSCALSGIYDRNGHPVRVLLSKTLRSQDQTSSVLSRIVSGLTILGSEIAAMTGDDTSLANFTGDKTWNQSFAPNNTRFADAAELIPDFFT